jgi:RNA polymerase sigma factor (sigma-70 family)
MSDPEISASIAAAQRGDADALSHIISVVRDPVYRLALRMVTQPAEAEDATQEILIKVMTRVSTFRGDAAFSTWVHRIAVNHLLDRRKSAVERLELTFDHYAQDLRSGLASVGSDSDPADELLATEVRLTCTQAMLTCLDRDHRVAYILGEVFEVSSPDGAYICDVSAATYRKRLSRARSRIRDFVGENCGLVSPSVATCRCERRIPTAVKLGRIDPGDLAFGEHAAKRGVAEMEGLYEAAGLMRHHPEYIAPEKLVDRIHALIRSGRYGLLTE